MCTLWHGQQSDDTQASASYPSPVIKINGLRLSTYSAKFQLSAIRGFRFIVLTYTPTQTHTHTHTQRDKVIAIPASPGASLLLLLLLYILHRFH